MAAPTYQEARKKFYATGFELRDYLARTISGKNPDGTDFQVAGGASTTLVPTGANLFGLGHSFLAGAGLSGRESADRYLTALAAKYGMVEHNFGVIGNSSYHLTGQLAAALGRATDPFLVQDAGTGGAIPQTGMWIINALENDAAEGNTGAPFAQIQLLAVCNLLRSGQRLRYDDGSCAYTGSWSTVFPAYGNAVQVAANNDNHVKESTTSGDYVTISFTGDSVTYFVVGQSSGTLTGASVVAAVDGVTRETITTNTAASGSIPCGLMGRTLSGFGTGSHTLRLTHNGAQGAHLQFIGWAYPALKPMPIVLVKCLQAFSASYASYNTAVDAVVASFTDGNVVSVDPNIGFNSGTMMAGNNHPNALGNQHYMGLIEATLLTFASAYKASTLTTGNHLR